MSSVATAPHAYEICVTTLIRFIDELNILCDDIEIEQMIEAFDIILRELINEYAMRISSSIGNGPSVGLTNSIMKLVLNILNSDRCELYAFVPTLLNGLKNHTHSLVNHLVEQYLVEDWKGRDDSYFRKIITIPYIGFFIRNASHMADSDHEYDLQNLTALIEYCRDNTELLTSAIIGAYQIIVSTHNYYHDEDFGTMLMNITNKEVVMIVGKCLRGLAHNREMRT